MAELNEIINITLSKFNKKYKQSFDDESIFREQYVKDLFIFFQVTSRLPNLEKDLVKIKQILIEFGQVKLKTIKK